MLEVNVIMFCRDCEEIGGEGTVRATSRLSRSESFVVVLDTEAACMCARACGGVLVHD